MKFLSFLHIIISLLIAYIIVRHIYRRFFVKSTHYIENMENQDDENDSAMIDELRKIRSKSPEEHVSYVKSVQEKRTRMPLRDYYIKGSYNTARTGDYMNLNMIEHVLSRGARFLDFEVFHVLDKNVDGVYLPKVAFTTDPTYRLLETKNSLLLSEVLSTVITNAFSETSPNNGDPVFINLRIKTNDSAAYKKIAKIVSEQLSDKLYHNKITGETKMSELMGKAVLLVDKTMRNDYRKYSKCADETDTSCYDLYDYVNLESGSELMFKYHYTDLMELAGNPAQIKDDGIHTTSTTSKLVVPDITPNDSNPDVSTMVLKYGSQIILPQYQITDKSLEKYERSFNALNGGVVPLAVAIEYFYNLEQQ